MSFPTGSRATASAYFPVREKATGAETLDFRGKSSLV
jgi:hypothetical protein